MTMRRVAILALACVAFSQSDLSGGSIPGSTTSATDSTNAESTLSVPSPPTTTTDAVSGMLSSSSADGSLDSTTRANHYSNETATTIVSSSVTASSLVVTVTDTVGVSSQTKTNYTTTTHIDGMGAGGRSTLNPSASATTTGGPLSDGVVNGVSIGLFFASVALTTLLQM